jgi:arylsulfate sulfotransferase
MHFLVSCRHLDEITKIHRTTGEIIWRFGGSQNEFNFINDYPFTHQHSIRSLGNNRYILFDNGNYSAL